VTNAYRSFGCPSRGGFQMTDHTQCIRLVLGAFINLQWSETARLNLVAIFWDAYCIVFISLVIITLFFLFKVLWFQTNSYSILFRYFFFQLFCLLDNAAKFLRFHLVGRVCVLCQFLPIKKLDNFSIANNTNMLLTVPFQHCLVCLNFK